MSHVARKVEHDTFRIDRGGRVNQSLIAAVVNAMRADVPPNIDVKNPTEVAPYMPAMGPDPVATP